MKKKQNIKAEKMQVFPEQKSVGIGIFKLMGTGVLSAGLCCLIAGMSGAVNLTTALMSGIFGAVFCTLSFLPRFKKIYPLVPAIIALLTALIGRAQFIAGVGEVCNGVILGWNERFSDAVSLLPASNGSNMVFAVFTILLSAAAANLLTLIDRPHLIGSVMVVLFIPAMMARSFSNIGAALIFTADILHNIYCCDRTPVIRKMVWGVLTTIALIGIPMMHTERSLQMVDKLRGGIVKTYETVRYGSDTLPKGDLKKAYTMCLGDDVVLEVKQTEPASLYLKGFVGADYEDGKWSGLTRADMRGEDDGIEQWLSDQGFDPATQYSEYRSADGSLSTENTVTVRNKGADRRYTYLPYSALDTDVNTHVKRDSAALSNNFFGSFSYSFKDTAERYPGELLYPADWVDEPETAEQNNYLLNEEIYRSFVYKNYLDVPKAEQDVIDHYFMENSDVEKGASIYAVTQRIHKVLESTSYYQKFPSKDISADNIDDFLAGGTGNSALFASAATLAYRAYGIPARYVEGYFTSAAGSRSNIATDLTAANAHAWVEVYADGLGWVPIDVTPGYYYDVYSLMDMVNHPENIQKTAIIEENNDDIDTAETAGAGGSMARRALKTTAYVLLGVIATVFALLVITFIVLEVRAAILSERSSRKFRTADVALRQKMIFESMPKIMKCLGIDMCVGWNAEQTEMLLREKFDDIYEGEYIKVNHIMEKCIYGETDLPPHELRMLSAFMTKISSYKTETLTFGERFRMKYFIY